MSECSRVSLARRKINLLPRTKALNIHGNRYTEIGTPDLHVTSCAVPFMTEWKEPGEVLRPIQEKRLREWEEAGAVTAKIVHLDEMIELIIENTGLFPSLPEARAYIREVSHASKR